MLFENESERADRLEEHLDWLDTEILPIEQSYEVLLTEMLIFLQDGKQMTPKERIIFERAKIHYMQYLEELKYDAETLRAVQSRV